MIDIKDKNNNVIHSVEITDKCVYSKTLMEGEYVLLSFESDTIVPLANGCYINTDFGKFYIVDVSKPTTASDGGYQYEQKFYVGWERLRNHILFYNRQAGSEKSWKMTQKPEYFLDIVCENIRLLGYGRYTFDVDADLTEMKLVEFDGTNIIDALTKIAETWETEWWIEDTVIHLSKCEYGSSVSLTENDEIGAIDPQDSSDTDYYTRAYVFGSTRNLPTNYRKNDDGNTVIEGIVETRLKLPSGISYVDAWEGMSQEDVVEAVVLIDDVYPRKTETIKTITTKEYTDEVENEDGSKTTEKWNAYRFTTDIKFSENYRIDGEELRIVFQTGKLAGMDFEVSFNPDGYTESESRAQVFEIIRNEDYGVKLPTDDFKPSVGDTFILYGFNTSFVYDNLVSEAEQELYSKAIEAVAEASKDKSIYNCPTNPVRCAGYTDNGSGKLVHNSDDEIDLDVGQSVTLRSSKVFTSGYRVSRVRSFEKRLDNKYNATYVIGEASAYSNRRETEEQIEELTYQSKQLTQNYGSAVRIVRRYDTAAPSDHNVPSFKRAQYEFLQKNVADTVKEKATFAKGLVIGDYLQGEQGGNIDSGGNAELLTLVVRSLLRSAVFRNGLTGEGWQLWVDANSISHLEIDRLTVRQIMTVLELVIERIRAVGGQLVVSAANGKIKAVEDTGTAYTLTFEGDNYFQAHDLVRCQVFTGSEIWGYWVEVESATTDSVTIPKTEFEEWGTEPKEGDEVVLMGNTENTDRQNLISISATEDGQPRIDIMDGVTSKSFTDCLRARLGNLDGISDSWFPTDNQPHGNGLYADNAYLRGTFLLTTGEDVKTKFEIVEGSITSSIEGLRQDFMEDKGFLNNPTFGDGLSYWDAENETVFFLLGSKWIWANKNITSLKGDGASVITDSGRNVVRIRNKYITQTNANLRSLPEIKTNADGQKEAAAVYLSFYYKVVKKGTLTIGFENTNNDGFAEYEPFAYKEELDVTDSYQQLTHSGLWNATGDFKISFADGEIYIYMLVLSTDRIETLTNTYKTLFEQSDKLVKIAAACFDSEGKPLAGSELDIEAKFATLISSYFDEDGNLINKSGLVTTATGSGIYAQVAQSDGTYKIALIGVGVEETDSEGNTNTVIKLTADHIQLEGLVTANSYFKINTDGSMEATNGKFSGEVSIADGKIHLNTDGSGQLAGGNIAWDTDGSGSLASGNIAWTKSGDLTLKNITAMEGTFSGVIKATKGLVMGVRNQTYYECVINAEDSFIVLQNSTLSSSDYMNVYLPASPNVGQLLTILNSNVNQTEAKLICQGAQKICPSNNDSSKIYELGTYLLLGHYRAKQFIFDGSTWWQVGQWDW